MFDILENFERFNQKNEIYCRAFWDRSIRSQKTDMFFKTYREPLEHFRDVDGFRQRDYSIRNAAWHFPDIFAELKEGEDRREGFLDSLSVHREGPAYPESSPKAGAEPSARIGKDTTLPACAI